MASTGGTLARFALALDLYQHNPDVLDRGQVAADDRRDHPVQATAPSPEHGKTGNDKGHRGQLTASCAALTTAPADVLHWAHVGDVWTNWDIAGHIRYNPD
jgi:hypothetical protein